jgi:formylglycine-generating enzyme required for sulfatase activity
MNTTEENSYGLTTTSSGGLIRRMDQRLELVKRLMEEIQAKQTGLSNTKTLEVPLGSGVGMLMKWCPAGSFLMGSPEYIENQVQVILNQGFWMGQTQVTQAQWRAVMGNNPSRFTGENRPVESVSWHEMQEFVSKLNVSFALPDGMQMTLPTQAQWEYAARAGGTGPYSGGTLNEVAWYKENSGGETHPVGTKKPNAWSLHDMHGNVGEMCADWHGDEPYTIHGSRGGSWSCQALDCRVTSCEWSIPSCAIGKIGFRVARSSVA